MAFKKRQAVSHLKITPFQEEDLPSKVLHATGGSRPSRHKSKGPDHFRENKLNRVTTRSREAQSVPTHRALGYFCEPSEKGSGRAKLTNRRDQNFSA